MARSRPGGTHGVGRHAIALWSKLPADIEATIIARLYRKCWRIEGMFQRLESVLHSEIKSLGHPRAALLGFAAAVVFVLLGIHAPC